MVEGAFKRFKHEHHFQKSRNGITLMREVFDYTSPFGICGMLAVNLFLKKYMTRLLVERNSVLKHYAESGEWESLLNIKEWMALLRVPIVYPNCWCLGNP